MGEMYFPDGSKLSDYAKKIATTPQLFQGDLEVDKSSGTPRVVLRGSSTLKAQFAWDIANSKTILESLGDIEFKVPAGKQFKFIVG